MIESISTRSRQNTGDRLERTQSFTGRFVIIINLFYKCLQRGTCGCGMIPNSRGFFNGLTHNWRRTAANANVRNRDRKLSQTSPDSRVAAPLCSAFWLDSVCTGTAGQCYYTLMLIKNKVPKRGLSLRKTEGRASDKNSTTVAVQLDASTATLDSSSSKLAVEIQY